MRTTLNLDADILDAARNLARQQGVSLGKALSLLARRGIGAVHIRTDNRIPTFDVAASARSFGTEEVKRALDEG